MVCNGWRSVFAEKPSDLSLSSNCLVVKQKNSSDISVPLDQINRIVVASQQGSISLPLINSLVKNNISMVICNEAHSPCCEILNLGTHTYSAGRMFEQAEWNDERKDLVWQKIVKDKIRNQIKLLEKLDLFISQKLIECEINVLPGDVTNREAQAARLYFESLFGDHFIRTSPTCINNALNYGYTIIRSSFDRTIAGYGYSTSIGIHHHSIDNRFNLSCDLMEPFRPCVDEVVYSNAGRELDRELKAVLVEILQSEYGYNSMRYTVEDAIDIYTYDTIKAMRMKDCAYD